MTWRLLAAALVVFLVVGCSKLTAENYGKLKAGMSYQEITGILGSPSACNDLAGFKSYT